jgi:hypothetical protein
MKEKEYILCAAIWYQDDKEHVHQPKNIETGYVLCGRRHHNCIASLSIFGKRTNQQKHVQGFITNLDRFVDRKEAGEIAFNSGQILKQTNCLFSEDLY